MEDKIELISIEDILGAFVNKKPVCIDCFTFEDERKIGYGPSIIRQHMEKEGKAYSCSRCDKPLGLSIIMDKNREREIEKALARFLSK